MTKLTQQLEICAHMDCTHRASLVAQMVKNSLARHETHFNLWVKKISLRRKWQPTSVFLPGEFHEQRSLEDYSPWRSKELDTPERLHTFTADYTLCCVVLSRSVMSDSLRPHGL